jgi:hypothetical protein
MLSSGLQQDSLATYGIVAPNTHVKALQFSRKSWSTDMQIPALNTLQFGMIVDTNMHIWDIENESTPVYTKKVCASSRFSSRKKGG